MTDIFVSYASEDRGRVLPLVERFETEGWSVWWDRELAAGPRFDRKIQIALDDASCIVVVWSESAIESGWCRDEAQEGLDRQVLVPVRIDDVKPPLGFRSAHTASLIGWPRDDQGIQSLITGIKNHVGSSTDEMVVPPHMNALAIAVMPFRNMSQDVDQEFFSDGVSEDILNGLASSSSDLIVRPASSTFSIKAETLSVVSIGERLGVTHVLEGSVRRSENRIRVTAQLSDVSQNRSVWSDRYDREMTDVFEVQDEITEKIIAALNIELEKPRATREFAGIEAYEAYLRGKYHNRRSQFTLASEWYERAAALDPNNADLWGERLRQLGEQMSFGLIPNTGVYRQRAQEYLSRALSLDPTHWSRIHRAQITFIDDRRYQEAIDEYAEVVISNPNSWEAWMGITFAIGAVDRQSETYFQAAATNSRLYNGSDIAASTEVQTLIDSGHTEAAHSALEPFLAAETRRWIANELTCRLATVEKDVNRLDQLTHAWADGMSSIPPRLLYYKALLAYLQENFTEASEIVSKIRSRRKGYAPFLVQHELALIERDLEGAASFYQNAVDAAEPAAMFWHRDTALLKQVFPEFVAFPAYQAILKDIGLDPESAAQIVIPKLPF